MSDIIIVEVSPRDGLQNEQEWVPTAKKLSLIEKLRAANLLHIEATSFVHPKKVPQMADASEVMNALTSNGNVKFSALIPNEKGLERAIATNTKEVNWVTAATHTFNIRNIGKTPEENLAQFKAILPKAKKLGIKVRFSVAVSFGCPYEGEVSENKVLFLVKEAVKAGADEIAIADTIGIAVPNQTKHLCEQVLSITGETPLAIHLHDTRGLGLTNAHAAYQAGVRMFETAVSGIGGCPFAPGAAGNLATEDLVFLFEKMGIKTGMNFDQLLEAADFAASLTSKQPLGRIRQMDRDKIWGVI